MNTLLQELPSFMYEFKFDYSSVSLNNQNLENGFCLNHESVDSHLALSHPPTDYVPSSHRKPDGDPPDNGDDCNSNVVLKYISEMLMEEDLESKTCMLQDCLALQAAEKSFYDVLGQTHPTCKTLENGGVTVAIGSNLSKPSEAEAEVEATAEMGVNHSLPYESRRRKSYQRDDSDYLEEGRSNKQFALSLAEYEESKMYDEVLLCKATNNSKSASCSHHGQIQNGITWRLQHNGQLKGSNSGTKRKKKAANRREMVDLWTLLTQCAQAVTSYDQRTANELLKQIRQHSSPLGDGMQRMAHYFAYGLEARLIGTETPFHTPNVSNRTSAADILKSYRLFVSACPFKKMSNFVANRTIVKLAEKATRLHIIDFGILYGFQWPCLIQRLSARRGGPPKLRITGIELPQPGLRPAERVEETGRRLKRYCERFNVPFEYNVIAQKWETIQLEDLKIDRDEMTIVNCLYRMKNLPDDTVMINSPRDAVLQLIKSINPDIFIHGVVNGTYSAPFFATRFREALFHFSALFDMVDATVTGKDQERLLFERETYGRDIMNVIACEGTQRVERPETYRQWQVRNLKAGFRQLPLDREILKEVKTMVKSSYHRDFVIDEDGQWMLQGWKGRVNYALSCWKPVQE